MYALINLFIYTLQHPDNPSVQSDCALMDIGAAHFARLDFATDGEVSITFGKDIAALARTAVKYHKQPTCGPEPPLRSDDLSRGNLPDDATGENPHSPVMESTQVCQIWQLAFVPVNQI